VTVALVTGATGQDGSYLCERLVSEGAELHAVVAEDAAEGHPWLAEAQVHQLDLRNSARLAALVAEVAPDEVYNLAGLSSVAQSWEQPVLTAEINAVAVAVLLQSCWELQQRAGGPVRVVQASSAEIFGNATESPQTERTPLAPTNPYGAAKAYAHQLVGVYRGLGLHSSSCILYNHESPRRPVTFVTRKITSGVAAIARGEQHLLILGALDVRRDWGWAPDYVDGMVRAARHTEPGDYVLATGTNHSVREFVDAAFAAVGIIDWEHLVEVDTDFLRPVETQDTRGDASRATTVLGWTRTVGFDEIVRRMVLADG
jgi:GDPmannose 4,6-dehydratase